MSGIKAAEIIRQNTIKVKFKELCRKYPKRFITAFPSEDVAKPLFKPRCFLLEKTEIHFLFKNSLRLFKWKLLRELFIDFEILVTEIMCDGSLTEIFPKLWKVLARFITLQLV